MNFDEKNEKKTSDLFVCHFCDFKTRYKSDFTRHKLTRKHTLRTNLEHLEQKNEKNEKKTSETELSYLENNAFFCDCGKSYKARNILWYHKKKCTFIDTQELQNNISNDISDKDMMMMMMQQNKELLEIVKIGTNNVTNTTVNNNNNNKTFNLQIFLNEDCKHAINMSDFLKQIEVQLSDVERIGNEGYVTGISNIICNELKSIDVHKRPIHCSDLKRETLYIKDEDRWEKDHDKMKIDKMIQKVSDKNYFKLNDWKNANPGYDNAMSKTSDTDGHIMISSFDGTKENRGKVMKNIAKQVKIDK